MGIAVVLLLLSIMVSGELCYILDLRDDLRKLKRINRELRKMVGELEARDKEMYKDEVREILGL